MIQDYAQKITDANGNIYKDIPLLPDPTLYKNSYKVYKIKAIEAYRLDKLALKLCGSESRGWILKLINNKFSVRDFGQSVEILYLDTSILSSLGLI